MGRLLADWDVLDYSTGPDYMLHFYHCLGVHVAAGSMVTHPDRVNRPYPAGGAVGSTYNYLGGVYNALIAAYRKGDAAGALALQRKSQRLIDILNAGDKYGAGENRNVS